MKEHSKAIDVYLKCLDMLMEQDTGKEAKQGNTTQKATKSFTLSLLLLLLLLLLFFSHDLDLTNGRC